MTLMIRTNQKTMDSIDKKITAFTKLLTAVTKNWKTITLFAFIVIMSLIGVIVWINRPVHKKEGECDFIKDQYRQLQSVLLDIRKEAATSTSYYGTMEKDFVMFASYDTVPKSQKRIISKIDSIIWKLRIDSMRNAERKKNE